MATLHHYYVVPRLPASLQPLVRLGYNLWWSWHRPVRDLFARIDPALYAEVAENPLALLVRLPEARFDELARDPAFVAEVETQARALDAYLTDSTWLDRAHPELAKDKASIAYFSMEFGIHECLPVYSGGLGVLAGDHLKSASDLGLPLVGVGVAFSLGYFRQALDLEGRQGERYPLNDWHELPVSLATGSDGAPLAVTVSLPSPAERPGAPLRERLVTLHAWRAEVGRVPLFLLDANLPENAPEDRALTNTLYGGDRNHRIRQELILGVGGVRMLGAAGIRPAACHMNEGHAAFLALERVRALMAEQGAPFEVAVEAASAGNIFTTHTPVPAGNDAFAPDLIAPYLEVLGKGLGKTGAEVLRIGRALPDQAGGEFSMPVLAIRLADRYNGVSVLHGREARAMWSVLWPGLSVDEVPIGAVTNGVHLTTWIAPELADVYERHLGSAWRDDGCDPAVWAKVVEIPDAELWGLHASLRARMIAEVRLRLAAQAHRRGREGEAAEAAGLLNPQALTIGFARRFATYKRGTLLFADPARLARILSSADRPVQLVFSGKAHPQDFGGKELIQAIVRAAEAPPFKGRVVFVEDYEMGVARSLVGGVDVWLNTPRRPLEASGTSGMKAALNGVLHASILDGWWCEAFSGDNGFALGNGEEYADAEYGDRVEADALYRLLEEQIVPMFYDRGGDGLPHGWIARMKRSIATVGPSFNTARMVKQYAEEAYAPAVRRSRALNADGLAIARGIAEWKARVAVAWPAVRVEGVEDGALGEIHPGTSIQVRAEVHLGPLAPSEVAVELYYGPTSARHASDAKGDPARWPIEPGAVTAMTLTAELGGGRYRYEGTVPVESCGGHAYAVRVSPRSEGLHHPFATRLMAYH